MKILKMHSQKFIFLILASLLIIQFAIQLTSAAEFSISMEVYGEDVLATYDLSSYSEQMIIELPSHSQILDVYLNNVKIQPNINENSLIINQSFQTLQIKLKNSYFVESNSKKYFTFNQKMPFEANLNIWLILPESATLDTSDSAYPTPQKSTDGQHIILDWTGSLKKGESFSAFVIYREKPASSSILYITGLIILVIAAFYIFVLPYIKKIREKKEIKAELVDSEKRIVNSLKKANGELWQKQIQLQTGFSKAKLSRMIRNLEARGVIKKIPVGNTNKIKLQ